MKSKKTLIVTILVSTILVGTVVFLLLQKKPERSFKLEEATSKTSTTESSEEVVEEEVKDGDPQHELEKTLEKPDNRASEKDTQAVMGTIDKMLAALEALPDPKSAVPDRESHNCSSLRKVLSPFKEYIFVGYKYDSSKTKVFESNLEGTVQFTMTLSDGKKVLVYSGNFDTLTEQIELGTYREGEK